jgi:hypothetical protein
MRRMRELIGEITVKFGVLEHMLEYSIWRLINEDTREQQTGQIVTAENSFGRNVDLFSSLYRHRFPQHPDKPLKHLCAKLFAVDRHPV